MKDSYSNLKKLTTILSDCQFHDGDTLGKQLGVTRASVWKMTEKLGIYGVPITSVKGKGYTLTEPLVLLDEKSIKQTLDPAILKNVDLTILETVDSTINYLKKHFNQQKKSICIAEQQTEGIGRLGRTWTSPFGLNLYFSCRYQFHCDVADLSGLSLAISIAVLKTLQKFGVSPEIKWPNDIFCHDKKCAGCHIELIGESNGACHAIISVGINVNMIRFPTQINQPWTSLALETQTQFNRNHIAAELIQQLFAILEEFTAKGLAAFKDFYTQNDYLRNQWVTVRQHNTTLEGKVIGIDDWGRLLLQTKPGHIVALSSGDATLKNSPSHERTMT